MMFSSSFSYYQLWRIKVNINSG